MTQVQYLALGDKRYLFYIVMRQELFIFSLVIKGNAIFTMEYEKSYHRMASMIVSVYTDIP